MGIGLLQKIVNLLLFLFRFARPLRASTLQRLEEVQTEEISTHKALAGLDAVSPATLCNSDAISTHKALAGLDPTQSSLFHHTRNFNPQGPRGPRRGWEQRMQCSLNFNPQGPRGPRPQSALSVFPGPRISTHKALAGLDEEKQDKAAAEAIFQPTRPSRASTANLPNIPSAFPHHFVYFSLFLLNSALRSFCHSPTHTSISPDFPVRISRTFHVRLAFAPA